MPLKSDAVHSTPLPAALVVEDNGDKMISGMTRTARGYGVQLGAKAEAQRKAKMHQR